MLTIISSILIIISLLVISVIIIKKLPVLAILDVNNIAGAKEAKFKQQIIKQRLERDLNKWGGFLARIWLALNKQISSFIQSKQARLKEKRQMYRLNRKISLPKKQTRIKDLFLEVEELFKKESFSEAEEKLIEIIGLDEKNLQAFFKLGELYGHLKKWIEAGQTYEHALKLAKQYREEREIMGDITIQEIYFSLAVNEQEMDNLDSALENIAEALDLEPNNPRYLDLILDLSIIKKDKKTALEYFEKLATVNPENNKLADLKERIETI